jgi:signal transduction histidine kinase
MAARIRAFSWAATPLGPMAAWPQSLKTAVDIALDSAFPTFIWWGPELTQLSNDAAIAILRPKHPAALGRPAHQVWSEIWEDVGPLFTSVLETGEPFMAEDLALLPDRGGPLEAAYFTFCYSALRDENGGITGMQAVAIETTAKVRAAAGHERAQAALQESEARQAFLLELSDALRPLGDPVAIQEEATRRLGHQLGVSRALYAEFRVEGGQEYVVIERDYHVADAASSAGRHPSAQFNRAIDHLRAGRTVAVSDTETELATEEERAGWRALGARAFLGASLVKDGRLVAGFGVHHTSPRMWTAEETALVQDTAERIWEAVERARAEATLRESEARYRTLFTSLNIGFCTIRVVFDAALKPVDYVFLDVNPAFEAQTGLVDAVGKRMRDLQPAHEEHWYGIYGRIALTGQPERFEQPAVALGRWYSVDAFRIGPPEHCEVGVLFEDITERKRGEAERQAFVDAAAHDLRTPLTSLKGRAQLLRQRARRRGLADLDTFAAGLEAVETDANRMASLIDEMLDAAHLQTGKLLELNRSPTDLAALAETVAEETQRSTTRHTIRVVADATALVGHWDEHWLRRVLANLLNNAVKYSPAGGEVVVRVGREDDVAGAWATLAVSDQGVGIPAADRPHLFERFHRGRNTSRIRGTGIGLTGARQIAEQHGGEIAVASVEGEGSTFTVRLPLHTG